MFREDSVGLWLSSQVRRSTKILGVRGKGLDDFSHSGQEPFGREIQVASSHGRPAKGGVQFESAVMDPDVGTVGLRVRQCLGEQGRGRP